MSKSLVTFIAILAALEKEVSTLAAEKWVRETELIDFESRTAVEKQLQQAYTVWPDYKALVDKYDARYTDLVKGRTLMDCAKKFHERLSDDDLDTLFAPFVTSEA
jgi:hypothetical protein